MGNLLRKPQDTNTAAKPSSNMHYSYFLTLLLIKQTPFYTDKQEKVLGHIKGLSMIHLQWCQVVLVTRHTHMSPAPPGTERRRLYSARRTGGGKKQRRLRAGVTLQGSHINCHACPFLNMRHFSNNIWLARHPPFLVLGVVTGQLWQLTKQKTCHYRLHPHKARDRRTSITN